ncbi:1-phosphatidylinositol 4,5-bisphosphate phosphodiesterase delta-1-like [Mobula hypostoma]|uniref:1-phosphatidylinositol 4,5-bisphosphate phosphodiesterase delta-1-like n=1 Tax=Mobula hypostoma TaxID=723540 RepID=UPI002FC2A649
MTKDGFLFFQMSPGGDIFNQEHDKVYQDMMKLLNQYYISSSHNTYLITDQLEAPGSTKAYIRPHSQGEMCWYRGGLQEQSQEKKALASRVKENPKAFFNYVKKKRMTGVKVTPYLLILFLKTHCHTEQQKVMVQHMKTFVGDKLLYRSFNRKVPSPEVISAQQLPKSNMVEHSSVVDLLVKVQVFGVGQDNGQKVTSDVSNNAPCGTQPPSSLCPCLSWLLLASWCRTMTAPRRLTSSDSSRCHSPAYSYVLYEDPTRLKLGGVEERMGSGNEQLESKLSFYKTQTVTWKLAETYPFPKDRAEEGFC